MKQVFDLVEEILESAAAFTERTGRPPSSVAVSTRSYRRLLEISAEENAIGNLIIGCKPIHEIALADCTLNVVIDEMLSDVEVVVG
jgi:hypothetical protein